MSYQTGIKKDILSSWLPGDQEEMIYIEENPEGISGDRRGIHIDPSLILNLAQYSSGAGNDPYHTFYNAIMLAFSSTILHEATHDGDEQTNHGLITLGIPGDLGIQNSRSIFQHRGQSTDNALLPMFNLLDDPEFVAGTPIHQTNEGAFYIDQSDLRKVQHSLNRISPVNNLPYNQLYNSFFNSINDANPQSDVGIKPSTNTNTNTNTTNTENGNGGNTITKYGTALPQ